MAKVLLVDDEPNILIVMGAIFGCAGHEVTTADGQQAVELLNKQQFDLVISDMRMAPVDGMEVLKTAKKIKPGMPVIMVTAFDMSEAKVNALKIGAYAYVKKPFDNTELLNMVAEAVGKSGTGIPSEGNTRS